jgi:hypothetical protein
VGLSRGRVRGADRAVSLADDDPLLLRDLYAMGIAKVLKVLVLLDNSAKYASSHLTSPAWARRIFCSNS